MTTGPKTSSRTTVMSWSTSVRTVGCRMPSTTSPPVRARAPPSRASSTQSVTRSRSPSSMSWDTSVSSSSGSPTTSDSTCSTSALAKSSATSSCTIRRWVEMHDWPACLKPAPLTWLATWARSASGATISGEVLPSSRPTALRGAASRSDQPTPREPVKDTTATSSCWTMCVAVLPGHGTTLIQPVGQAGLGEQVDDGVGRQGRGRRGLEHDGAPGRDRRGELVEHEVQGEVERGDGRHDPARGPAW